MSRPEAPRRRSALDWIEWAGNKLPEPLILFVILALLVIGAAHAASVAGCSVQPRTPRPVMAEVVGADGQPVLDAAGRPELRPVLDAAGAPVTELVAAGPPIEPRTLLDADGVYWMFSSMLRNFTSLPALGLIFVAMLGIGVAERFGLFSALMRSLALITPRRALTPVIVLIGACSSVASDAGYVILPPLAAGLYAAVGRHPIAGLAAAFCGVAGGFGAGFFPTGGDGALTGFAQDSARVIAPDYTVTILHNAYFKATSAIVVMLAGWYVTDRIVEPRLRRASAAEASAAAAVGAAAAADMTLTPVERRALVAASGVGLAVLCGFLALIFIDGMPLHGTGLPRLADGRVIVHHAVEVLPAESTAGVPPDDILARKPLTVVETPARGRLVESPSERWSHVIVPMIFFTFLLPGLVYGRLTGAWRTQREALEGIYSGIRSIVPVLAILFFMAQFVNYFAYTRLDRMLAHAGGALLVQADLPVPLLLVLFVLAVVLADFALSGMLSKFGVMAPIFIPMFMFVGMSPELTTAAYRIGDSVVNVVTPLNSYMLIVLAVLQKYQPRGGLGSLIALMVPYSAVLFLAWTGFLLVYWWLGYPLGPGAPLHFTP